MNLAKVKNAATGIIRETMAGGRSSKVLSKIANTANKSVLNATKNGILFQHRAASLSNGFSGIGLSKLGWGLVGAGIVGKGAVDTYKTSKAMNKSSWAPTQDIGSLSTMSSDAIGTVNNGNRDLGATGDLVFGLHSMDRRGR